MATIKEDYVSFETAKLLKEKGFDESISMVYMSYGDLCKLHRYDSIRNSNYNDITKNYFECTAPTLQMAMKWLREVHKLYVDVYIVKNYSNKTVEYCITIEDLNVPSSDDGFDIRPFHESYEEAAESAIKYCLDNLI